MSHGTTQWFRAVDMRASEKAVQWALP